jgi:hypothetical protein
VIVATLLSRQSVTYKTSGDYGSQLVGDNTAFQLRQVVQSLSMGSAVT